MKPKKTTHAGARFPIEIISHTVWLYYRFSPSFHDIEEMLAARGVAVAYGSIRHWRLKFGKQFANGIRRRQGRPGDIWHPDEMSVSIDGVRHHLWRAVDQDDDGLDILVRKKRNGYCRQAIFPETAEKAALRAEADFHRQARPPWSGSHGADAHRRACSGQRLKQPGGELPPNYKPTGKADAAIQGRRPYATVPCGTWPGQQRLPGWPPSNESKVLPHHARASLLPLG